MAKSKGKTAGGNTQLKLFNDEQPAVTKQDEEQTDNKQTEQPPEPVLLKKRVKGKKPAKPSQPVEAPALQESEQPPTSTAALPVEEPAVHQLPADARLIEEREAQLKEKFKKVQEERLAALRKARGKK